MSHYPMREPKSNTNMMIALLVCFAGVGLTAGVYGLFYAFYWNAAVAGKQIGAEEANSETTRSSNFSSRSTGGSRNRSVESSESRMDKAIANLLSAHARNESGINNVLTASSSRGDFAISYPAENSEFINQSDTRILSRCPDLGLTIEVNKFPRSRLEGESFEVYALSSTTGGEQPLEQSELTVSGRRTIFIWKYQTWGAYELFAAILEEDSLFEVRIQHAASDHADKRLRLSRLILETFFAQAE